MKRASALLLALVFAACTFGADIVSPDRVDLQTTVKMKVTGVPPKSGIAWKIKPLDGQDPSKVEWISPRKGFEVRWIGPAGKYEVSCIIGSVDKDGVLDIDTCDKVVTLGDAGPTPDPGPGPSPDPTPTGFRVLIVFDDANKGKMPEDQRNVIYDDSIREYLQSKCVKGPDGKTAEFRIWPHTTDAAADNDTWVKLMARPRKDLPWMIVTSNGKAAFEGPLPKDTASTMAVLKKYGG